MKKYEPYCGRMKIGYCSRKNDEKDATKRKFSIAPHALIKTRIFITAVDFKGLI